jgi:hypothetical protein
MDCGDARKDLRRFGPEGLSGEALRHAAACPRCAAEARGAALLRLGSGGFDGAARPRPGFAARVRAGIAVAAGEAATPRAPSRRNGGLRPRRAWSEAFDRLLRPALVCAATLALLAALLYARSASSPASADLATLAEDDSVLEALP